MIRGDICDLESVKEEVDMVYNDVSVKIEVKEEQVAESNEFDYKIKLEDIKSDLDEQEHLHIESEKVNVEDKFPAINGGPFPDNLANHKNSSSTYTYHNNCDNKTGQESNLPDHVSETAPMSKPVYKFKICGLEIMKQNMNVHLKTHSETKTYECQDCSYSTISKKNFNQHAMTNKHLQQLFLYKCQYCWQATQCMSKLRTHMVKHQDMQEMKIFECDLCSFKTKYRSSYRNHCQSHENVNKGPIYKCPTCSYETYYKSSLNRHYRMTHDDTSKIMTHKCEVCGLQTKYKDNYNKHLTTHNSVRPDKPVKIFKVFNCGLCKYWTNQKYHLSKHMLKHKTKEQVQMYKCNMCEFETKYKPYLSTHKVKHMDTRVANV